MNRATLIRTLPLLALLLALGHPCRAEDAADYKKIELPFEQRVADIVKRMTLQEKAGQVQSFNKAVDRPGLTMPPTSWYTEAGHGAYPGRDQGAFGSRATDKATSFPVPLGMAASWDAALLERVADAIGDEARVRMEPAGAKWKGIIVFCPMINMARDPRWGRTQECYGEDPLLAGKMGAAFIRGVQGNDPKYLKTAAIVKHFAMNSQEIGRTNHSYDVSERALREYYLPAFETCLIQGKASGVMSAYNGINKVPCVANSWLLTDLLRTDWGFAGPVVTDYRSVGYLKNAFRYPGVTTDAQAVAAAMNAGVDVIADERSGGWDAAIIDAVQTGLVKPEVLDRAVARDMMVRMRLGFFDPPEKVAYARIAPAVVGSKEHLELARQIAREGMVLLKNDPAPKGFGFDRLLPLDMRRIKSIAVLGPYARMEQFGDYSPAAAGQALTPLEAITQAAGDRITVRSADSGDPAESGRVAASCDVAIVVAGLSPNQEHEGIDRPNIDVFEDSRHQLTQQGRVLEAVVKANPLTIVVLQGGGAMGLAWVKEHCPAIVMSWYAGEQGADALADVLMGKTNPSGRLPVTFYRSTDDLPPMDDYEISKGRTYMYLPAEKAAVFPFGHGLSYTQFSYANMRVEAKGEGKARVFSISVDVTNSGERDGDEVVQLYVRKMESKITRPIKQLKGFERVAISKGQTKSVRFTMPVGELAYWDVAAHQFVVEAGAYEAMIGGSSEAIGVRGGMEVK